MKPEKVFIGDIKKCTKYIMEPMFTCEDSFGITAFGCQTFDSEVYKKDAVLIQISEGVFIPLSEIRSFLSYYSALGDYRINGLNSGRFLYVGSPFRVGQQFIDDESLKPYFDKDMPRKDISIRSLKKDIRKR